MQKLLNFPQWTIRPIRVRWLERWDRMCMGYWCGRPWVFFLGCSWEMLTNKNNITISSNRTTIEHQSSLVGGGFLSKWCLFFPFEVMPRLSPVETFAPSCRRCWLVFSVLSVMPFLNFCCFGFTIFLGAVCITCSIGCEFFFGGRVRFRWCKGWDGFSKIIPMICGDSARLCHKLKES